jgi:regulator of sigma E protease
MHPLLGGGELLAAGLSTWILNGFSFIKVLIGFSLIIFVHELGHFLAAKWVGIRVDRFSVGFGTRLFGYRGGEGFTFGNRPEYRAEELAERGYGETDYCFRALPLGGYVKMLGQDDIVIDDKTGAVQMSQDPRAFPNRPVGSRMIVVSAGVVFNIVFAALLIMLVYLIGRQEYAPRIGLVLPDSPARGKLLPNDVILEANGKPVRSFDDLMNKTIFANEVRLRVERNGQPLPEEVTLQTEKSEDGLRRLNILPASTTVRAQDGSPVPGRAPEQNLLEGDKVLAVDGQKVALGTDVFQAMRAAAGREVEMTVERPSKDVVKGAPRTVTCYQRPSLVLGPDGFDTKGPGPAHLLGMLRRTTVQMAQDGSPAQRAGLRRGDVIAVWGAIASPRFEEIKETIVSNPGKPIPVTVERLTAKGRESVKLEVTPRAPFRLWGKSEPQVGVSFGSGTGEEYKPVVADVLPDTPAAELGMPRGALLLSVDGKPVETWFDVVEALRAAAGRRVPARYRTGADEVTGELRVPGDLMSELDLPTSARVVSIDGQKSAELTLPGGKKRNVPVSEPTAAREVLEGALAAATQAGAASATVEVRWTPTLAGEPRVAQLTVTPDNVDPWLMRVEYAYDEGFNFEMTNVSAGGNPLTALLMGADKVVAQVRQAYTFFTRLATRDVSASHVAGPVGIVTMGVEQAKLGVSELMWFLAYLSISLAVINFMPMPILDGGLMVFLIIEKVKGKPLSFKTQMVSTLVGLAAILLIAVFVTIQDIGRLFEG